jgi:FkbM family methyltransferase
VARLFIDVGGYHGESSLAALDPAFGFERVFCVEPVPSCVEVIRRRIADRRFVLVQACLLDARGSVTIYNPGSLGASVYSDAPACQSDSAPQTAVAIDASDFFRAFVRPADDVWLKLNCEGSECAVLESLLAAGVCGPIRNVLVDFDARKIPSQSHRVSPVQQRLLKEGVPFSLPEDVQYGNVTNYGGVRNWLVGSGARRPGLRHLVRSAIYNLGIIWYHPECAGYHKMKVLTLFPFLSVFAKSRRRSRTGGVA